jgi:small subunit ribosomal protein S16
MKALGRRHRPFFRICAIDSRKPRDGRPIEELGYYDPMARNPESQTVLDVSRIRYWLSVGAQPSEKVQVLLKKSGVKKPAPGEPWRLAEAPAPMSSAAPVPAPAPESSAAPVPVPAPESSAAPAPAPDSEVPQPAAT